MSTADCLEAASCRFGESGVWAVVQDPFGNEFCLVNELTPEQSGATLQAESAVTNHDWRVAAGQTAKNP